MFYNILRGIRDEDFVGVLKFIVMSETMLIDLSDDQGKIKISNFTIVHDRIFKDQPKWCQLSYKTLTLFWLNRLRFY